MSTNQSPPVGGNASPTLPYWVIMNDSVMDSKTGNTYFSLAGFWNIYDPIYLVPSIFSAGAAATGYSSAISSGLAIGIPSLLTGILRYIDVQTVFIGSPSTTLTLPVLYRFAIVGTGGAYKTGYVAASNGQIVPVLNGSRVSLGVDVHLPISETDQIIPIEAVDSTPMPILITGYNLVYEVES